MTLNVLVELDERSIVYQSFLEAFHSAGISADFHSPLDRAEREKNLSRCHILVTFGLPDDLMGRAENLRFIQMTSKGFDTVNIEAAADRGIVVCGIGPSNAASVAQHAWGLILALSKRIVMADRLTKEGKHAEPDHVSHSLTPTLDGRSWRLGTCLWNRTIGIVGLGDIGSRVARIAQAFQMRILACDPYVSSQQAELFGAELVELPMLLSESDVVSLHVPLTEETMGMLGAGQISQMKTGAILVNTSRGPVVDEAALLPYVKKGLLSAGLDVVCNEPLSLDSPFRGELRSANNFIVTPHLGAATEQTLINMRAVVCENILRFQRDETPLWILNQDEINRGYLGG